MREIKEAEAWYRSAEDLFNRKKSGAERYTVVVAQSIHALIRANDALTSELLGRRSTRHEDAGRLFGELVRQRKIPQKHAGLRKLVVRASAEKSEYDYKGKSVGKKTAERWLRNVRNFIDTVREILATEG